MNVNHTTPAQNTLIAGICSEHNKHMHEGMKKMYAYLIEKIKKDQTKIAQIKSDIEKQKVNPLIGFTAIHIITSNIELTNNFLESTEEIINDKAKLSSEDMQQLSDSEKAVNETYEELMKGN